MDVLIDNKIIELNCYVDPNHNAFLFFLLLDLSTGFSQE
jgi:hypothetical protein